MNSFRRIVRGILARTKAKVIARPIPAATQAEIVGIPLFLDQLIEILKSSGSLVAEAGTRAGAMAQGAATHGATLLERGFTVAQVVHDYGGCVRPSPSWPTRPRRRSPPTNFASSIGAWTTPSPRRSPSTRAKREHSITAEGREQLGELAHELRNAVGAAIVSFEVLRMGKVGLEGSTAGVLSRSLQRFATLIDCSLTEVRLESGLQSPERVSVRDCSSRSPSARRWRRAPGV